MKKKIYIILVLVSVGYLFAQSVLLDSFQASSDGKDVSLDWRSSNESNIAYFELERGPVNQPFKYIATEKAKGYTASYNYKDDNVFMKNDADTKLQNSNYSYRIKIVKKDNSFEYSNTVNVVHKVSGIQKTWGMIKEIFR